MKKLVSALILFIFCSTNSCFAFSELYYFKNIKTSDVEPIVNSSISANEYNIIKQNPYYATSKNGDSSAIIVLQQSGENMFYYYQSDKNTKINKSILKEIKRQNIIYEQSFNQSIIDIYDNIAQNLAATSGEQKRYTFEDEPIKYTPIETPQIKQKPQTYSGYVTQLATGTKINAYLQNAINTASATVGDRVIAVVSDNIIFNNEVVIPQGSVIYGTLKKARHATYGSRNGRVVIDFNQIVTPENQVYNISTEEIDFTVSNDGKVTESLKNAAAGAAAGALVGLLFGLLGDKNALKSAAIGAGVGAGSTVIYSTAERGVDAEIPSYTELDITLTRPLSILINK